MDPHPLLKIWAAQGVSLIAPQFPTASQPQCGRSSLSQTGSCSETEVLLRSRDTLLHLPGMPSSWGALGRGTHWHSCCHPIQPHQLCLVPSLLHPGLWHAELSGIPSALVSLFTPREAAFPSFLGGVLRGRLGARIRLQRDRHMHWVTTVEQGLVPSGATALSRVDFALAKVVWRLTGQASWAGYGEAKQGLVSTWGTCLSAFCSSLGVTCAGVGGGLGSGKPQIQLILNPRPWR